MEKKRVRTGAEPGGGSATGGQQHGDTVSVLQPGTWTWTWTWTLWNSRARRGTGREARHGRHSSGKMHKAVVSWLLYMTVLQQRPLPRNRGRLAGPRGRGLVATHEGPKRGRWRARGRGALVFPGFAAAAVVVASGELRLGGGPERGCCGCPVVDGNHATRRFQRACPCASA